MDKVITLNSVEKLLYDEIPIQLLCIIRLTENDKEYSLKIDTKRDNGEPLPSDEIKEIQTAAGDWISILSKQRNVRGIGLCQGISVDEQKTMLLAIRFRDKLNGMLMVERKEGIFDSNEILFLHSVSEILGQMLHAERTLEEEKFSNFVFNTMLDGIKASLYVSDPKTDKILFMNKTMKEEYGITNPEGQLCWKVLQNQLTGRCSFCPVRHLDKKAKNNQVIQWEETSSLTGKSYMNYDSMIYWIDGTLVHLQQSIDITELKSANTDELTQLLTRRPGKEALQERIQRVKEEGETITVCLYDVNLLKETNDKYGHAAGDKLIVTIIQTVQEELNKDEYMFRLSGDEFVAVFSDTRKNTMLRMDHSLETLSRKTGKDTPGFCYGLAEITQFSPLSAEEALLIADEKMYEQKNRFHIEYNEHRRMKNDHLQDNSFSYDKEHLYNALVQSTDDYIYVCNMKTGIFKYTQAMVDEFKLPSQVISNAAAIWGARVHEDDRPAFLEANQIITDGRSKFHCVEYRALNRNGEWVWVRCRGHLEYDEKGEPSVFAGFIKNLGKKNKIDNLTGLYNKLEFEEQVCHLIDSSPSPRFGIMLLNIDDLKNINDLYDKSFGDEVVRIVSQKIQTILPEDATIYRLDGDEFGIISRETGRAGMEDIYKKIFRIFQYQQDYDGKKYYSTLSGGCTLCPEDAQDYNLLTKYAGYAMEHAKKQGKKNCVFFSPQILNYRTKALEMIEALRESAENNFEGFSLRYQPVVEAGTGNTVGFETLARWHSSKFGDISPVEFIPLLESSGLIIPVGRWIMATALHTCRNWVAEHPELEMNVNISYLQIEGPNFVSFLKERIEKEDFPAQNLVLEMTESVLVKESRRTQKIFDELRSLGIRIAMDDFGTGYSSLGLLKNSPSDIVKIDKTFMRDVLTSNFDATFIKFVVALCHDVGIKVCLEGVETMEEYGVVFPMGLDMIQGYYFGYPIEEEEFRQKYI